VAERLVAEPASRAVRRDAERGGRHHPGARGLVFGSADLVQATCSGSVQWQLLF
jgi:hypothetical protein